MGASEPNKRATPTTWLLQKENWKEVLRLTEKRVKGATREKAPRIKKKELLILTSGDDAYGRNEGDGDDDGWEPVVLITSPCDSISGYWGLSAKNWV